MQKIALANLALIASLASTMPAHAYIDPATGTLIVQSLIGGIAAAATLAGVYIAKVRAFFNRLLGREPAETPAGPEQ